MSAGTSQVSEETPDGGTHRSLSGLNTEAEVPTNVGARITRRRANAGEPTVTKVLSSALDWEMYHRVPLDSFVARQLSSVKAVDAPLDAHV